MLLNICWTWEGTWGVSKVTKVGIGATLSKARLKHSSWLSTKSELQWPIMIGATLNNNHWDTSTITIQNVLQWQFIIGPIELRRPHLLHDFPKSYNDQSWSELQWTITIWFWITINNHNWAKKTSPPHGFPKTRSCNDQWPSRRVDRHQAFARRGRIPFRYHHGCGGDGGGGGVDEGNHHILVVMRNWKKAQLAKLVMIKLVRLVRLVSGDLLVDDVQRSLWGESQLLPSLPEKVGVVMTIGFFSKIPVSFLCPAKNFTTSQNRDLIKFSFFKSSSKSTNTPASLW